MGDGTQVWGGRGCSPRAIPRFCTRRANWRMKRSTLASFSLAASAAERSSAASCTSSSCFCSSMAIVAEADADSERASLPLSAASAAARSVSFLSSAAWATRSSLRALSCALTVIVGSLCSYSARERAASSSSAPVLRACSAPASPGFALEAEAPSTCPLLAYLQYSTQ